MNWMLIAATVACAAGVALFYYWMEMAPNSPKMRLCAKHKDFRMPDVRFRYTPDELYGIFSEADAEGRPLMRRYWLLDFGLIACFLGVMILIGGNVAGWNTALFWIMGILSVVRAVFDLLEDGLLMNLLSAYPTRKNAAARLAGIATKLKFLFLYAWVAILFVKLFAAAFKINL